MLLFRFVGFSLGVDGDVVHVDQEPSLGHFGAKDGVHHHLEGG